MSVEGRGWGTRVGIDLVNWQQEEAAGLGRRRQASGGGTSRMSRHAQVRICERLGVQLPGRTRRRERGRTRLGRSSRGGSSTTCCKRDTCEEMNAEFTPMRWPGSWKSPSAVGLLKGTPINWLLVDRDAGLAPVIEAAKQAEITSPDYPGERLMICHNPLLEEERGRCD